MREAQPTTSSSQPSGSIPTCGPPRGTSAKVGPTSGPSSAAWPSVGGWTGSLSGSPEVFQHYQGATNLLVTELSWRHGPIRVLTTDFVAMGPILPRTAGGTESPGQYVKRFRIR